MLIALFLPVCPPRADMSAGDKTFLIAAIMATRHPRITVFGGAFASLVVMSILSAALGKVILGLIPKVRGSSPPRDFPLLIPPPFIPFVLIIGLDAMGRLPALPRLRGKDAAGRARDGGWKLAYPRRDARGRRGARGGFLDA